MTLDENADWACRPALRLAHRGGAAVQTLDSALLERVGNLEFGAEPTRRAGVVAKVFRR